MRAKEFIIETNYAKLYHGTNIWSLASIISDNALYTGTHWGNPGEPDGPRTTRSIVVAKKFYTNHSDWDIGGVLVLDQEKLRQNHKVVPYHDNAMGDEAEEVIVTSGVQPLDRYLINIIASTSDISEAMSDKGLEYAEYELNFDIADMKEMLKNLLLHPKRIEQ